MTKEKKDQSDNYIIKEGGLRLLTAGEIQLAQSVFTSTIEYPKVWIHRDSYLPFNLQDADTAMTPNGEIYFRNQYRDDFSQSLDVLKHMFIHEMSHVWQRARGMRSALLSGLCLLVLTGCPEDLGVRFNETAKVSRESDSICFSVTDAQDYQPADIGINPRGIPSKSKHFIFSPDLVVSAGKLCVPPSFYLFPDKGQFIVEYRLRSEINNKSRKVVVTFEINNGYVYNVTPTESEIFLPYCRFVNNSTTQSVIAGACQL